MELQVGVKILIKNTEGRYLLLKRSPERYPDVSNPWDIVGGRIDPGASLRENLAREMQEETGMTLTGQPKLIGAQDIIKAPAKHVVRLTYIGTADGTLILSPEHTEGRWFSLDELRSLAGLDRYVKELLEQGVVV